MKGREMSDDVFEEEVPVQEAQYGTLDARGWEIPDPRPVEVPIGFERPESLQEKIQRLVRTHVSEFADAQGYETFDEADDFEVDEEDYVNDPTTPFEEEFDPVLGKNITADEFLQRRDHYREEYAKYSQPEEEQVSDSEPPVDSDRVDDPPPPDAED